jgi:hypothetical protein
MWPAVMFANKRIINAKGFEMIPMISTHHDRIKPKRNIRSKNVFPVVFVTAKVNNDKVITDNTIVTAMLPVKVKASRKERNQTK